MVDFLPSQRRKGHWTQTCLEISVVKAGDYLFCFVLFLFFVFFVCCCGGVGCWWLLWFVGWLIFCC